MRRLLLLALSLTAMSACSREACKSEPAGFQLDIAAGAEGSATRSLTVELVIDGAHYEKSFDLAGQLADGATSLAVTVDGAPSSTFTMRISTRAYAEPGGRGALLAEAQADVMNTPDGCNRHSLSLRSATGADAGPVDLGSADAGSPDAGPEDTSEAADAGAPDTGEAMDAGLPDTGEAMDAEAADSGLLGDVEISDLPPLDAGFADAEPSDLGALDGGASICQLPADPSTAAQYDFENNLSDTSGRGNDGALLGSGSSFVAGPAIAGCGSALSFSTSGSVVGHGQIPHAPAFQLPLGSIDLYLRRPINPPNRPLAVLAKDSSGNVAGSLALWLNCDGVVVLKFEGADGNAHYRCSAGTLAPNVWSYVGINFGPGGLDLYVDGVRGERVGRIGLDGANCNSDISCGGQSTDGLSGNQNPWILGASSQNSPAGSNSNLSSPFRGGAIDRLRISSSTRSF